MKGQEQNISKVDGSATYRIEELIDCKKLH